MLARGHQGVVPVEDVEPTIAAAHQVVAGEVGVADDHLRWLLVQFALECRQPFETGPELPRSWLKRALKGSRPEAGSVVAADG